MARPRIERGIATLVASVRTACPSARASCARRQLTAEDRRFIREEVTMLERLRRTLTFANVTSVIALVFAMGGGAYAVTSNSVAGGVIYACYQKKTGSLRVVFGKQKCKKSEKAIAWNRKGPEGMTGATGAPGQQGPSGAPGPFVNTLPSGQTIRGSYDVGGRSTAAGTVLESEITFPFPLSAAPTVNYIPVGGPTPAGCSGDVTNPGAAPGNLCIFAGYSFNTAAHTTYDPVTGSNFGSPKAASRFGVTLSVTSGGSGGPNMVAEETGTWATTAP
jgi:hypothetical protein